MAKRGNFSDIPLIVSEESNDDAGRTGTVGAVDTDGIAEFARGDGESEREIARDGGSGNSDTARNADGIGEIGTPVNANAETVNATDGNIGRNGGNAAKIDYYIPEAGKRKRRGRQPAEIGGNQKAEKLDIIEPFVSPNKSAMSTTIKGFHEIVATATKCPELAISAKEADALADQCKKIAERYGIGNGNGGFWVGIIITLLAIYAPRAIAIYARTKK